MTTDQERCFLCLQTNLRMLHIRRHGSGSTRCGPHPVCVPCSVGHANWRCSSAGVGQVACPVCRRGLGSRRRALVEEDHVIEHRVVVAGVKRRWGPISTSSTLPAPKRRRVGKQDPTKPQRPECFYSFLDVSPKATDSELERAYRRLAKTCHPDKAGGSTAKFQKLLHVFQSLLDPVFRAHHDERLRAWEARHGSKQAPNGTKASKVPEEQAAAHASDVQRRVGAFLKILADMPAQKWADFLQQMPRETWTDDVLKGLLNFNRREVASPAKPRKGEGDDDEEERRPATDAVESGLVSLGPPHRRTYYCRMGWEGLLFNSQRTLDFDQALADHAALLRMRSVARQLHAQGRSLEESVLAAFSYPSTVIHFQFCVANTDQPNLRRNTPMTANVDWFLSSRRAILSRRGQPDWWTRVVTKLSNCRTRIKKVRADWLKRRPNFIQTVEAEVERRRARAAALCMVNVRLRGKTCLRAATKLATRETTVAAAAQPLRLGSAATGPPAQGAISRTSTSTSNASTRASTTSSTHSSLASSSSSSSLSLRGSRNSSTELLTAAAPLGGAAAAPSSTIFSSSSSSSSTTFSVGPASAAASVAGGGSLLFCGLHLPAAVQRSTTTTTTTTILGTDFGQVEACRGGEGSHLATHVASELIAYLETIPDGRSPAVQIPWFQQVCRRLGLSHRERQVVLQSMEEDAELRTAMMAAFRRARMNQVTPTST